MAPEQARGEPLDERADVFSLGAILFATLVGRAPFTGATAREVVSKTANEPPPSLRERVPDAPDDLAAIVERATARDRGQRYPSAEALAADLKRFTTGQLVKARRYTRSELLIRWLRRHRGPLSIAGAAALALLVVGVVSVTRIVREKRRADVERAAAQAAQARESARVDQLILAQATESLDHDPTAAMAWLGRLRPESPLWREARAVASEAQFRGVAQAQLAGHHGPIAALAFAPDGARLFSAGDDGALLRWQLASRTAEELDRGVKRSNLALSGDGTRLVAGGADGSLVVVDAAGKRAHAAARRGLTLGELALSADGRLAAAVTTDGIRVYSLDSGDERTIEARDPVSVSLSRDGTRLAFADSEGVHVVDTGVHAAADAEGGGHETRANNLHSDSRANNAPADSRSNDTHADSRPNNAHADSRPNDAHSDSHPNDIHADSRANNAYADSRANNAHQTGARGNHGNENGDGAIPVIDGKFSGARTVRLTPDGRWLAVAGKREARAWDLAAGGPPFTIALAATATRLDFSPDGARIALGLDDGAVRLWEPSTGRDSELAHHGEVAALDVRFAPDGKRLAAARGSVVRVWDLDSSVQRKLRGPPADVLRLAWSADGALLATGAADGNVRIWRVADGDSPLRRVAAALPDALTALSGDGRWLARVADKNVIVLHDVTTGAERMLPAPPPNALMIGGHWLCAVFGDDAWCWEAENPVQKSVRAPAAITDFAIAADGKTMAMATDGAVLLVDTAGAKPRRWSAPAPVVRVALAPDGSLAAVAGEDGEVLLLDGNGARRLGHAGPVAALGFSGDGAFVVARGRDERSIFTFALANRSAAPGAPNSDRAPNTSTSSATSSTPSAAPSGGNHPAQANANQPSGDGAAAYLEEDPITAWSFVGGDHILLTGSATGAVRARDLDGGRQWTLSGHRGRVLAVAGSAAAPLWSAGEDGTVRSWPIPAPPAPRLRSFIDEETSLTIDDANHLR